MTLAYDQAGDGPVVVLLHSRVTDRRMWDGQWEALLAAGFRLVRCDFRGHGETPAPETPHSDDDDVLELMDSLGIARFALAGSSYGGRVALRIAARKPERVRALALLCASMPGHVPSPRMAKVGARAEELAAAGRVPEAVMLLVDTWLGPEADGAAREAVRRMRTAAYEARRGSAGVRERDTESGLSLSAAVAPALVVTGGHDLPDFAEIGDVLSGVLRSAWRVHLPWAGHLPGLERPDVIGALLTGFLAGSVTSEGGW